MLAAAVAAGLTQDRLAVQVAVGLGLVARIMRKMVLPTQAVVVAALVPQETAAWAVRAS